MPRIDIQYSSHTFEFRSKFPKLHMPPYPVASPDIVNFEHASHLVDGEHVALVDGKITKITAGNLAGLTAGRIFVFHGQPGRSDLAVAQAGPIVMDDDFEADTRLIDQANPQNYVEGTRLKVGIVTFPKAGTAGLVPANAGDEYVATQIGAPVEGTDGNVWVRVMYSKGARPA